MSAVRVLVFPEARPRDASLELHCRLLQLNAQRLVPAYGVPVPISQAQQSPAGGSGPGGGSGSGIPGVAPGVPIPPGPGAGSGGSGIGSGSLSGTGPLAFTSSLVAGDDHSAPHDSHRAASSVPFGTAWSYGINVLRSASSSLLASVADGSPGTGVAAPKSPASNAAAVDGAAPVAGGDGGPGPAAPATSGHPTTPLYICLSLARGGLDLGGGGGTGHLIMQDPRELGLHRLPEVISQQAAALQAPAGTADAALALRARAHLWGPALQGPLTTKQLPGTVGLPVATVIGPQCVVGRFVPATAPAATPAASPSTPALGSSAATNAEVHALLSGGLGPGPLEGPAVPLDFYTPLTLPLPGNVVSRDISHILPRMHGLLHRASIQVERLATYKANLPTNPIMRGFVLEVECISMSLPDFEAATSDSVQRYLHEFAEMLVNGTFPSSDPTFIAPTAIALGPFEPAGAPVTPMARWAPPVVPHQRPAAPVLGVQPRFWQRSTGAGAQEVEDFARQPLCSDVFASQQYIAAISRCCLLGGVP
ncbi:hypothetical protein H696_00406 [Fonticula alba]|uniref:Uncharacterized protein n=1 Tax=Fonticula alba TaxID=691883 RepID=A0A058ZEJ9_FONAL|nr:hypothetical protein H696_00406 [Fonticula alba]KCV72830.1 hypothetical protein H696_00406 [Fonticula alba]|eukprot:XP_009492531.1 hypothetical protein H696_00406 [Fonticula alba]